MAEYVSNNTGVRKVAVFKQTHPKRMMPAPVRISPRFTDIKVLR